MGETYLETYRGCVIYRYSAGTVGPEVTYSSPCVKTYYRTLSAVKKNIDAMRDAEQPPPEEPVEPPADGPTDDDPTKNARAQTIYEELNNAYDRFLNGLLTESAWIYLRDIRQEELAELDWPPWEPPKPPAPPDDKTAEDPAAYYTQQIAKLMEQYGFVGDLRVDRDLGNTLRDLMNVETALHGLGAEAIDGIHESPAEPAQAAALAKSYHTGVTAAVAGLAAAGVAAEIASLGQIESIYEALMKIVEGTGLLEMGKHLALLPLESGLFKPSHHYWNSVYQPELPGSGDLIRFVVREVIEPSKFTEVMSFQGFSSEWSEAYWAAHWVLPSRGEIIEAYHRGLITEAERDKYIVWHDYTPDRRPGISVSDMEIIAGLQRQLIPRVDLRRAWEMGLITDEALEAGYVALGYEDQSQLMADIQKAIALEAEKNAVARPAGRLFRDGAWSEQDFRAELGLMGITGPRADLWVRRYQLESESPPEPGYWEPGTGEPPEPTPIVQPGPTLVTGLTYLNSTWSYTNDIADVRRDLDRFKADGVKVICLPVYWSVIEPMRGAYNMNVIDRVNRIAVEAQARGIQVIHNLHTITQSGSQLATPSWIPGRTFCSLFTDPEARQAFLDTVHWHSRIVEGDIHSYQPLNEPVNTSWGCDVGADAWLELMEEVKAEIGHPAACRFAVNTLGQYDDRIYELWDYTALNYYHRSDWGQTPSRLAEAISKVKALGKEVWITETGMNTDDDQDQAEFYAEVLDLYLGLEVDGFTAWWWAPTRGPSSEGYNLARDGEPRLAYMVITAAAQAVQV